MLSITRYRVDPDDQAAVEVFVAEVRDVLDVLGARPGWLRGRLLRAADDPWLWVLVTEWDGAGPYRRALSSFDVRVRATPLLARALPEPTAYEPVVEADAP